MQDLRKAGGGEKPPASAIWLKNEVTEPVDQTVV